MIIDRHQKKGILYISYSSFLMLTKEFCMKKLRKLYWLRFLKWFYHKKGTRELIRDDIATYSKYLLENHRKEDIPKVLLGVMKVLKHKSQDQVSVKQQELNSSINFNNAIKNLLNEF